MARSRRAVSFHDDGNDDDDEASRFSRDGASLMSGGIATGVGSVAFSMGSSTALNSSLETLANSVEQNDVWMSSKLTQLVGTLNKSYNERRREKILHLKALRTTSSREGSRVNSSTSALSEGGGIIGSSVSSNNKPAEDQRLVRPYRIMPDRHKALVADVLERAKAKNEVNELTLYVPAEGKFMGIVVDEDTGKHRLKLLESDRFLHADCATWRLFPADRAAREPLFLLQNVFSALYLGVCPLGHAVCRTGRPSAQEHLRLAPDANSGLLILHIPHCKLITPDPQDPSFRSHRLTALVLSRASLSLNRALGARRTALRPRRGKGQHLPLARRDALARAAREARTPQREPGPEPALRLRRAIRRVRRAWGQHAAVPLPSHVEAEAGGALGGAPRRLPLLRPQRRKRRKRRRRAELARPQPERLPSRAA